MSYIYNLLFIRFGLAFVNPWTLCMFPGGLINVWWTYKGILVFKHVFVDVSINHTIFWRQMQRSKLKLKLGKKLKKKSANFACYNSCLTLLKKLKQPQFELNWTQVQTKANIFQRIQIQSGLNGLCKLSPPPPMFLDT